MEERSMQETVDADPGAFSKLFGVISQPGATFEAIARKPTWIAPLIGMILFSYLGILVLDRTVGIDTMARNQIERQMRSRGQEVPESRIETSVKIARIVSWVQPVLAAPIMTLLCAGAFMIAFMLMGASLGFKQAFSITAHVLFVYFLITGILTSLIFLISPDPASLDIRNPIQSNLGFLVDSKTSPILNRLASSLDVIVFYTLALFAVGFSKLEEKLTFRKALSGVLLVWIIWVGLAVAFRAFTS